MRRPRLSPNAQARLLVVGGAGSLTAGVYGMAGWPSAALAAGTQAVAYGLLFVDVDRTPRRTKVIERGRR